MLLSARLREIGLTAEEARRTPPRHAALRDDPAALALRLFRDHVPLSVAEQDRLLDGTHIPARLLQCRLDIVGDLYLFNDWPSGEPDEVLPPGETTAILFRAARTACPCDRILDLGCGSGTLALLLAPYARQAVGTDVNPRAIHLARLNAELNGIVNVDFRCGSLYEPVAGESFDLIVSQPPFVPRPPEAPRHLFLHGGERGDELAREIIVGIPSRLTPQGRAWLFSDWPLAEGERLQHRIPAALRTHLMASPPLTLESYARSYGHELCAHFSRIGITAVRQCLASFEHGSGFTEQEVLPHQWSSHPAQASVPPSASLTLAEPPHRSLTSRKQAR